MVDSADHYIQAEYGSKINLRMVKPSFVDGLLKNEVSLDSEVSLVDQIAEMN